MIGWLALLLCFVIICAWTARGVYAGLTMAFGEPNDSPAKDGSGLEYRSAGGQAYR